MGSAAIGFPIIDVADVSASIQSLLVIGPTHAKISNASELSVAAIDVRVVAKSKLLSIDSAL